MKKLVMAIVMVIFTVTANANEIQIQFTPLGVSSSLQGGDNFVKTAEFKIESDQEVETLKFKNNGTTELENALENVALFIGDDQASTETRIVGDYITFRLIDGMVGSQIFSMRSDIISVRPGDAIELSLEEVVVSLPENATISVTDPIFSVRLTNEHGETLSAKDATLPVVTLHSGGLRISRDPSSPGNQEFTPESNNVVSLVARSVTEQSVGSNGITVELSDQSGFSSLAELNESFDNFRLFVNDQLIGNSQQFTGGSLADAKLVFNTTFRVSGYSIIKIVGDITEDAKNGQWIKVSLDATDFHSPKYVSTGIPVPMESLLGSAIGSFVEVRTSSINIVRIDGFEDEEIVLPGYLEILRFVADNNDSGDALIPQITVDLDVSEYPLYLFSDDTEISGPIYPNRQTGVATFDALNVIDPSAGQVEFTVKMVVPQAAAGTNFSIALMDVVATNVATGTSVPVTGIPFIGTRFYVAETGSLYFDVREVIPGKELTVGVQDTLVPITFLAFNDEVQIKELEFQNICSAGVPSTEVSLWTESGEFIQKKYLLSNQVSFNFASWDRIKIPADDSVKVWLQIKVLGEATQDASIQLDLVRIDAISTTTDAALPTNLIVGSARTEVFQLKYSSVTSVSSVKSAQISAFPNPTPDFITLTGIENGEKISIFDLNGSLIKTSEYDGNKINITALSTGTYFIRGEEWSKKIIKK